MHGFDFPETHNMIYKVINVNNNRAEHPKTKVSLKWTNRESFNWWSTPYGKTWLYLTCVMPASSLMLVNFLALIGIRTTFLIPPDFYQFLFSKWVNPQMTRMNLTWRRKSISCWDVLFRKILTKKVKGKPIYIKLEQRDLFYSSRTTQTQTNL